MAKKDQRQIEYGDFQTPDHLCVQIVALLNSLGIRPRSVVEPTCGTGAFLVAAIRGFETMRQGIGLEINEEYFRKANARLCTEPRRPLVDLRCADFFSFDWSSVIRDLAQPVLFLGNPPWVTSSGMGAINGTNLPTKSNFQKHRGLDAITGKGNFDIAEWMLIKLLEAASGTDTTVAMLVKTSVARRLLVHAWRHEMPIGAAAIYNIDAAKHFGVAASACLFLCTLGTGTPSMECELFDLERPTKSMGRIGFRNGRLVGNAPIYDRIEHLISDVPDAQMRWRSGVKHDCSTVMELHRVAPHRFMNGLGEVVDLEHDYLYPMMKGSAVARGHPPDGQRWMIVPQRSTGDDTASIAERAPLTWQYLNQHGDRLDRRGSSIYRKRPRFAVFGIGPYTFAPWKVAICGLYKRCDFTVVGPFDGRPVVFDDTVYHLSFESEKEARCAARLLSSDQARDYFDAVAFWDAKRPITADVLSRLDLRRLAHECGESLLESRMLLPSV